MHPWAVQGWEAADGSIAQRSTEHMDIRDNWWRQSSEMLQSLAAIPTLGIM